MERIKGGNAVNIAASVEGAIHAGRLQPGAPLPTVRELAGTLQVSPTTVAAAYKLLQARGLVSGRGRRGTRITAPPRTTAGLRRAAPPGTIDLATGNPDPALLPPLDQALRSIPAAHRLYDGPALLPALATFVAGEFEADAIPAGALAIVGGGLDGIERVLREHLRPGDRVAVEDPSFPGVLDLIAANGFVPSPFDVDDQGPAPDAFERALRARARAVVITPRAQNPTGAALTPERARTLRRILKSFSELLVIEDDYAAPIAAVPAVTLCGGDRERWAVIRSVSKFLGPDLRAAFVAGDAMTVARVEARQALGARWVSHLLQQLVLALWSDPSSARRLARAAEIYRQRRHALCAALGARGLAAHGRSGLNVWVPVREEAHTCQALVEKGWAVAPGERFRIQSVPGIRITAAALPPEDAERFANDLADAINPARSAGLA